MEIQNTRDYPNVPNINILIYGRGGVGKSTFGATFPKPLFLDFENGVKYFKQRGIEVPVVQFQNFPTKEEQQKVIAYVEKAFETIIIDPIGEAMEKLMKDRELISGAKYRQQDGSLTMAGWGKVKDEMRTFIKALRDTGKNVVIIAHTTVVADGEVQKLRPLLATKLIDELIAMVDIVGYLDVIKMDKNDYKRIIRVNPADERYDAKDRTGALPDTLQPNYQWIYNYIIEKQAKEPAKEEPKEVTPEKKITPPNKEGKIPDEEIPVIEEPESKEDVEVVPGTSNPF